MSASTIYVTASTSEEARKIAHTIVSHGLAACANILGNISSIYQWKGEVREEPEIALIIKTRRELIPAVVEQIKELHSYDCPCITAVNIADGNVDYINWIQQNTV